MGQLKTYDLKSCIVTLGGYNLGGYGDDAAIEVEIAEDLVEMTIGLDGEACASFSNNALVYVNITFMETAKALRDVDRLRRAQRLQRPIVALPFTLYDTLNGDKLSDQFATFVAVPGPSKGKRAGTRTVRIALPSARDRMELAEAVTA